MSSTVVITCEAPHAGGICPERVHITESEIQQVMDHPDASPRNGDLDTARHIAGSIGWTTRFQPSGGHLEDRCPAHSGRKPRPRRLTP